MFSEAFNLEILRAVEIGLMRKWMRDKSYNREKIYLDRDDNKFFNMRPFVLHDLYPAFAIWVFGICLSVVAFFGELIFKNRRTPDRIPYLE